MSRTARSPRYRPAIWSPAGIEPLETGTEARIDVVVAGTEVKLAAAAIHEAIRRPLRSVIVHTVAERVAALDGFDECDRLLDELQVDTLVARLRLAELARWLCRFGPDDRHLEVGILLLSSLDAPLDRLTLARLDPWSS
ncbi:hypothetical protein [Frondihabitans australicus]|uniref:Uncharacterized protein n=1 Tax=Frondihabitans australicus TaxID=386892 RepID=A0A495IE44_9MICO|nr:hypothetical protein [Frondihabitans australicus]RKR73768.1 hypothetical protein C8E83_0864 [Frondihabitans australicus]